MARLIISLIVGFIASSSLSLWARAEAPPCGEVVQMIMPCMPYLADGAAVPFGPCCTEVVALNQAAPARPERIAICRCLEDAGPHFPGVDFGRATALMRLCGVVLQNVTVSPNFDSKNKSSSFTVEL